MHLGTKMAITFSIFCVEADFYRRLYRHARRVFLDHFLGPRPPSATAALSDTLDAGSDHARAYAAAAAATPPWPTIVSIHIIHITC
jgi:hypothetical protein